MPIPVKITVTEEMKAAVDKEFAPKDANGQPAGERRFKVVKLLPDFNFGAKGGGKQPAFEVHRLDKEAWHTPPAKAFLETHVLLNPEPAAAPAE
jgi:hypothetical protein